MFNDNHTTKNSLFPKTSPVFKIISGIITGSKTYLRIQQRNLGKKQLKIALARLENQDIRSRLAGISDLAQIAQEYPQFHWVIMVLLTDFIRYHAPYLPQEQVLNNCNITVRVDIQAAMTVIGKRDTNQDPINEQLDLSHTDMQGINLNGVNLEHANLYQVNLQAANLSGANLSKAILSAANLQGANLNLVNLEGAILSAANLDGANLEGANLDQASLYLAKLPRAIPTLEE
jgi:uncharacterized protein YjbI with pentapeptide repeats